MCLVVDRNQAKRVWGDARLMGEKSAAISKYLIIKKTYITSKTRAGWLRPLSKDTKNKDSGAPCLVIVDEYHAHPNSEVVDVLQSGFGKRYQSLMFYISTAGKDAENNPCKREYDIASRILSGEITDENYFAMIRELDEGDNPSDKLCGLRLILFCSMRRIHNSVSLMEQIEKEHNIAYGSSDPDKIREFLTKRCDLWQQDSEEKYLSSEQLNTWKELAVPLKEFQQLIKGRDHIAGYDLSKKIDLTAYGGCCYLDDGRVAVWAHGFIPEESVQIHEKKDNVPYRSWIRDGWVTETPGAVVDYDTMSEYVDTFIGFMGKKPNEDCFDPYM